MKIFCKQEGSNMDCFEMNFNTIFFWGNVSRTVLCPQILSNGRIFPVAGVGCLKI